MPLIEKIIHSNFSAQFKPERIWKPALIITLCLASFWPTLKTGFMIDDPFLLRAVQIDPGLTAKGIVSDFTENVHKEKGMFYYRPVLGLMVRLEYAAWGGRPEGYHIVSLLFHTANAVLLFYLLSSLGLPLGVALPAACLFAVNPVVVDDLLAATGGESMANFFMLTALLLFIKDKPGLAWAAAVPAVFAKESNVLLPALLLLCFAFQGRVRKDYAKVLWLLPLSAFYLALRHLYIASPPEISIPAASKFLLMVFPRVVLHYLITLFAPLNLETWPRALALAPHWGPGLAAGLAAIPALFLLPVRRRVTAFCLAWFLLLLAPRVPAILATEVMMDKWVFMASPAVFVLFLSLLIKLADSKKIYLRTIPPLVVGGLCVFWMAVAHAEVRLRGSDENNYRWTIRNGPRSFASYRLGLILLRSGRAAEALEVLRPLPKLYPEEQDYQNAFDMALWHSGKQKEAWALMQDLARRYPADKSIQENAAGMRARLHKAS